MKNLLQKKFPELSAKKYEDISGWIHFGIILMLFILFHSCFQIATVPTLSMYPELDTNEFVLAVKTKDINYGDIVLFDSPTEDAIYIKRLIGMPGDTLSIKGGKVWRNGEALDEEYVKEYMEGDMDEITVPEGSYFMMGDNRNHSGDSRYFGPVQEEAIRSKSIFHTNPFHWFN